MCKICDWIRSKFCDSKTAYEEMEEYKAKYQNPSSRTTADKGVKIFLSSYHKWRTEVEMAHPSKTGLKLGENLYGEILIIFSVCLDNEADQTKLPKSTNTAVSYFRDVNYRDDVSLLGKDGNINMHDAFFVKSKAWDYENELRYLYFDINGSGDHQQIKIPNCISAIYFGLRCTDNDRKLIMDLMKGKKWTTEERKFGTPDKVVEHDVKFYKIVRDKNCFGKLVAEEVKP